MLDLHRFVVDFLKQEDGPTSVEYALILGVIIVISITAITSLGTNANEKPTADKAGPQVKSGS